MIAFAGYPLLVENRLIGVMAMFARQRLSDVMLQAMAAVANEMAVGIERKLAEEPAQRNYERIRALHEIDKAISSTLKLTEVLDILLKSVEISCPFAAAMGVRLCEKATRRMVPVATRNILLEEWADDLAQTSGALVKTLVETKSPVAIPNLARDPRTGQHTFPAKHRLVSYLGIPLIVKDEVIGTLVIYTKEERAFTGEEIEFCMTLGGQAAMAIQNATLYLQTERHLKRIEALHEIDNAITSTLELSAVLQLLLEKIVVFLPVPAATNIRLFNPATGKFENTACRGIDESRRKAEARASGQLAQRILETKRSFFIENIQTDSEKIAPSFFRKQGFVSYLGVPLIAKNEVVGILGFYTRKFHQFDQQEVDFLLTLAGQAAIAIHNAQLYEQINVAKSSLESTNQSLRKSPTAIGFSFLRDAPVEGSRRGTWHFPSGQPPGGIFRRGSTGSSYGHCTANNYRTGK
jgi:GAF domain-containing protein